MRTTSADEPALAATEAGSLWRDVGDLYLRPTALFVRLPRWNRTAGALGLLIAIHVAYAVAVLSTGVVDYEAEAAAQREISRQAAQMKSGDPAEERAQEQALELLEKGAVFSKLLARVLLVLGGPVRLLLGVAVLGGILFVVVALGGAGKPDFQLLAGVAAFAAYAEVPGLLLRLLLIAQLGASRVETSAAAFVAAPQVGLALYVLLRRLDPFDAWYWLLVWLGVWKTGQLSGRAAVVTVIVLALLAMLVQCGLDALELGDFRGVQFTVEM